VLAIGTNAVYALGSDGKGYLMWLCGRTLVAQEFEADTLKLAGEPHPVADPVARSGASGHIAVAAGGILLYSASNTLSQFIAIVQDGSSFSRLLRKSTDCY
jgi:hypothetical protein